MGFVEPETWIYNGTQDALVFFTENEFKQRSGEKRIKRGCYAAVSYRKGHNSAGRPRRHFLVFPENRPDLEPLKIMPSQVYQHANIKVVYKLGGAFSAQYQDGAVVGYEFEDDTMFHRIGLVRRFGQLCAKLGNCYHTTPAPAPAPVGEALAPVVVSAIGEALALVGAQAPESALATGETLVLVGAPTPVLPHAPMEAPAPVEPLAPVEAPALVSYPAPAPVLALGLVEAPTLAETPAPMSALALVETPAPVLASALVLASAIDAPALAETPNLMEAAASALLVAQASTPPANIDVLAAATQGSAPTLHSEIQVAVNCK